MLCCTGKPSELIHRHVTDRLSSFSVVSGGEEYETSPYEPVAPVRHPDAFRLASIISGTTDSTGGGVLIFKCSLGDSSRERNRDVPDARLTRGKMAAPPG